MPLVKLTPPAGVITEITDYQAAMRYTDADKVRFRYGQPEKIGGWAKRDAFSSASFNGVPRNILPHRDIEGRKVIYYGTSTHVYAEYGNVIYDITPFRTDPTTLTDPFTTGGAGTSTITVTHTNHGVASTSPSSRVVISSVGSAVDGVTVAAGEYFAVYVNANTYTLTAVSGGSGSPGISGAASSGSTAGGGSVVVRYLTNNGPDDGLTGYGFGAGLWGASSWGTARSTSGVVLSPRVWSMDAWGEDIVAAVGGGEDTIYYFDVSAFIADQTTRGTTLAYYITNTLSGDASQVPTKVGQVLVSTPDRHLCVFGTTPEGSTDYDRTTIRFASQESLSVWNAQITNTAGSQKLGTGTNIEAAEKGRGQIYVWTDVDLYGMQFVGPPFTFSFQQLGEASGTISKNAAAMIEGGTFWMGTNNFYAYDGAVSTLDCPVLNRVFDDFSQTQREKVFAAQIIEFNEVWWFYASSGSTEIDKYVIYNYIDQTWSVGSLERTAWSDAGIFANPIAVNATNKKAFSHESGSNDDGSALAASLETGYFSGDENGDNIIFMSRIIPDTTFSQGTSLNFTLKSKRYPNDSETTKGAFAVTSSTKKLNLRARGRSFQCRWESTTTDTAWRLGTWRAEGQADGTR